MTELERFNKFLARATFIHGTKFDYSQCNYTTAKTKVKIICPTHGEFFQTPDKHLAPNSKGCPKCWDDLRPHISKENFLKKKASGTFVTKTPVSVDELINRFQKKHGEKYSYEFISNNGFVSSEVKITCPIHGAHFNSPHAHLQSITGCPQCGFEKRNATKTKAYDIIIDQLAQKHNHFYEYPESNREIYKNKRSKIEIICPLHGPFIKKAQKHLAGQGCWPCKIAELIANNSLVGGYSNQLFEERPELAAMPATIYYIKVDDFYKIGITRSKLSNRISAIKSKAEAEQIQVLFTKEGGLMECFLLEQAILSKYNQFRILTNWSSEVFSINVLGANGFENLSY